MGEQLKREVEWDQRNRQQEELPDRAPAQAEGAPNRRHWIPVRLIVGLNRPLATPSGS